MSDTPELKHYKAREKVLQDEIATLQEFLNKKPKSRKIKNYQILTTGSEYEFNPTIELFIKQGYKPFGTPIVNENTIVQAMIQYEE